MNAFFAAGTMGAHTFVVAALLAVIALAFVLRFVIPALLVGRELGRALRRLAALQKGNTADAGSGADTANTAPAFDPARIGREAMQTPRLAHLWREYAQTLHAEYSGPSQGTPSRWRATALAETFFTEHALVDTPLRTEFYKHLPGILTGIGILGTFSGLIFGLADFSVGSDAAAVRGSLNTLIQSVGSAFRISAAAIGLAMLFTWIEKSLVSARYRQVAELTQRIDSCFESGAGEDYLARLLRASERGVVQAAQQATQLEQALVGALRQAFAEMLAQQGQARQQEDRAAAATLARAVGEGLKAPLAQLAAVIERSNAAPGAALAQTLNQTVGERLDKTLEMQTRHASDLQTFQALQAQWRAELDALRQAQRESQAQHAAALSQAVNRLNDIGTGIGTLVEALKKRGDVENESAERLAAGNRGIAQTLDGGAAAIRALCGDLAKVGANIGTPVAQLVQGSERLGQAAERLSAAAADCAASVREHNQLRGEFSALLHEIRSALDAARREAALTPQLVERLEAGAKALGAAQQRAEQYLNGINEVLAAAHEAFAKNVERTLREGNGQFHREVAEAVGHLRGAIDELGDVLDAAVSR